MSINTHPVRELRTTGGKTVDTVTVGGVTKITTEDTSDKSTQEQQLEYLKLIAYYLSLLTDSTEVEPGEV